MQLLSQLKTSRSLLLVVSTYSPHFLTKIHNTIAAQYARNARKQYIAVRVLCKNY